MFLGTPLRGTATASIAKWLVIIRGFFGKETSKTLLKGLEEENECLDNLIHDFAEMAIQCNIQIRCFYETHKTQVGRAVMSGLQLPKVMVRFTVNSMIYRLFKSLNSLSQECQHVSQDTHVFR